MQGGCDNLFEQNTMEHVCFETADASGFYVGRSWVQRGNVVRHNTFRHIRATTRLGSIAAGAPCCQQVAFYLDDEISGFDFYGNTIENAGLGVLLGGGRKLSRYRCRLGCILLKMPAISLLAGARLMAGAAAVKQESDALLCTPRDWHVIRPS